MGLSIYFNFNSFNLILSLDTINPIHLWSCLVNRVDALEESLKTCDLLLPNNTKDLFQTLQIAK